LDKRFKGHTFNLIGSKKAWNFNVSSYQITFYTRHTFCIIRFLSDGFRIFWKWLKILKKNVKIWLFLGLTFRKDLYLASAQIYPPDPALKRPMTRLQERLIKKLGDNAHPFYFELPPHCPASVTLQPAPGDADYKCLRNWLDDSWNFVFRWYWQTLRNWLRDESLRWRYSRRQATQKVDFVRFKSF